MGTGVIDWGVGVMEDGPIKSVADLKGKKIGIFSLGTGGMPLLKGYLRANGINPDTDVQIIATGAGAPALEALKTDRVQALMFWGSALAGFENAGTKMRVLVDPAWRALPDFTFGTMQKTIDADPAMVEAISRGAAKATLFAQTNPDCTRAASTGRHFPSTKPTGADEATLARNDLAPAEAQLETMRPRYELNGGKLIGAIDPGRLRPHAGIHAQGRPHQAHRAARIRMLIDKPGFVEAINRFDQQGRHRGRQGLQGLLTMTRRQFIAGLPKAELHMHIEGSIEPDAVLRTGAAQRRDDRAGTPRTNCARPTASQNLQDFLEPLLRRLPRAGRTPQDFHDVTREYLRRAHADSVLHAEMFLGPQGHTAARRVAGDRDGRRARRHGGGAATKTASAPA